MTTAGHTISHHVFLSHIQRGGLAPGYFLLGEEEFLLDGGIEALRVALFGESADSFNYDCLFAEDTNVSEILSLSHTLPVCASRRMVAVKHCEKLNARSFEALSSYLSAPVPTTCLVLAGTKIDHRSKAAQAVTRAAIVVDCQPLTPRQIPQWIKNAAKNMGFQLDDQAVVLLHKACGSNLYSLKHELDKLAAYVSPNTAIAVDDVQRVLAIEPEDSIFDILSAIGRRDQAGAVLLMRRILEAGEPPLRMLAMLATQFRQLWKVEACVSRLKPRRPSPDFLAKELGLSPFRVKSILSQVERFSPIELAEAFERFREADARLKGHGAQSATTVLESLVLTLCRKEAGAMEKAIDAI